MIANTPDELLRQLCADLRLMWREAGGPSVRALSGQVGRGKSQIGAILNGDIRTLPDWDVVKGLVDSFRRHAQEHDRMTGMSLRTGVDAFWRPRYAMLEHAFQRANRPGSGGLNHRATPRSPSGAVVPRQLPAAVRHFAGRAPELETLTGLVDRTDGGDAIVIAAIDGMAGIGKTTLAVSWAHRVAGRFSDGQLYINLRGFEPTGSAMSAGDALRALLDALQVPPQRIPAGLDAQLGLYRSVLADKRILLVLDNARDAEQVRPLLPGSPGCLVVVTSRNRLSSLVAAEGAHPLTLGLLSAADARQLLASRLGANRVSAHADAVDSIIARSARLPLALSIVAARAATVPQLSLDVLAAQLNEAQGDLAALADWDQATDLRTAFSWSYRALHPDAARLFRLLGLHPGPEISAPAAASLTGLPLPRVRPLLAELTRANLVVERIPGRYTLHDLLRAYAAELADTVDSEDERHAARHRMLDHYLHTAFGASHRLYPDREVINLVAPRTGTMVDDVGDRRQAMAWLTDERQVLMAVLQHAADTGRDSYTWQLTWTIATFLPRRGYWHDLVTAQRLAISAATRTVDLDALSWSHRNLADTYISLDLFDDARANLEQALDLVIATDNQVRQADVHLRLSELWQSLGQYDKALDHAERALVLYRTIDDPTGVAVALNLIGRCHTFLGDHGKAHEYCQRAHSLLLELGNRDSLADAWSSIGLIFHHQGKNSDATAAYQEALSLHREIGNRLEEARTLTSLGDNYHTIGRATHAHNAWRQALSILDDLAHPGAEQIATRLTEHALDEDIDR